jgi:hypothetical protein
VLIYVAIMHEVLIGSNAPIHSTIYYIIHGDGPLRTPLEGVPRKAPWNCLTLESFVKVTTLTAEGGVTTRCVLFSVARLPLLFPSPVDVEPPHG